MRSDSANKILADTLKKELNPLLAVRPTHTNPIGLYSAYSKTVEQLGALGFVVNNFSTSSGMPIIVAVRQGLGKYCIGLSGHYDIEEECEGWNCPVFEITEANNRLYGRGIADNLGPLWLRLLALEELGDQTPNLVFVLQGEEEISSPAAHALYPTLLLPKIDLWLEETGYFEIDGSQRVLVRRCNTVVEPWIAAACDLAVHDNRAVVRHDRYLNKAFGESKCPFLTHLIGETPYLAIGPNDPLSNIHRANESLAIANLTLSQDQFKAVLSAAILN